MSTEQSQFTKVPRRADAGPVVPGRLRCRPEDFRVHELPLRPPAGEGTHVWVEVEKRGLSTFRMLDDLAPVAGVPSRSLGHAGLKDAIAVTRQWVSIPPEAGVTPEHASGWSGSGWQVLQAAWHPRGLRPGALSGNRFELVMRGCDPDRDFGVVQEHLDRMARRGVVNGFGPQRFGKHGDNVPNGLKILTAMRARDQRRIQKRKLRLLVSAVQSEVFHRVLVQRVDQMEQVLTGDLAWLHRNGACFLVEDPEREQPRADAWEISPTGPLPGPKAPLPGGDLAVMEAEALASMDLTMEHFAALPHKLAPGDRRPLRVPLLDISLAVAPPVAAGDGAQEDLPAGLAVGFALPAGSYATAVMGEILGAV